MKKKLKKIIVSIYTITLLSLPFFVFAQSAPLKKLQDIQSETGYATADQYNMVRILGKAVNAFLGLLGIIFVILILYAGYNWMTAAGDEAKVTKAKDTIQRAIIGLIIVVGSYAIFSFIFSKIIMFS